MMPAIKQNQLPRVLMIEDEPLLQLINKNILELMGVEVTVVDHPRKAMALWGEHWDLIFSDIGLPDIRGTELCQLRRAYEKAHGLAPTPAFAYSAFGPSIENECIRAGFDGFGVKPMDNHTLYVRLQTLLPQFALHPLKGSNQT